MSDMAHGAPMSESATTVCANGTGPNQPVVVAQGIVSLSRTVGAPVHVLNGDWTNILATGYSHGASGGRVSMPRKDV